MAVNLDTPGWNGPDDPDKIVCWISQICEEFPNETWNTTVRYNSEKEVVIIHLEGFTLNLSYIGPVTIQDFRAIEQFVLEKFRKTA